MIARRWALILVFLPALAVTYAQDLTPRAYLITPFGSHAVILSSSFSRGQVLIDPTVPVDDARGTFQASILGYYESFNFFGRSSNVTLVVPYARADFTATLDGSPVHVSRSGLSDARVRFAVNLSGGPAMDIGEYLRWKEKGLVGVSLTVSIPTGQYDSARVINNGSNRWGVKPEIGFSRRWGHWAADWYAGAWLFTANNAFYPGQSTRVQKAVGAVEAHLGYYVRPRLWVSADANFWAGDRSIVNRVAKEDAQRNSRIGVTASVPLNQRQSLKVSYNQGAYVTVGGDYKTLSVGWQYSWITRPQ